MHLTITLERMLLILVVLPASSLTSPTCQSLRLLPGAAPLVVDPAQAQVSFPEINLKGSSSQEVSVHFGLTLLSSNSNELQILEVRESKSTPPLPLLRVRLDLAQQFFRISFFDQQTAEARTVSLESRGFELKLNEKYFFALSVNIQTQRGSLFMAVDSFELDGQRASWTRSSFFPPNLADLAVGASLQTWPVPFNPQTPDSRLPPFRKPSTFHEFKSPSKKRSR